MIAVLLIVIAVGGFFAYKKFGPKKEVKQASPFSKTIQTPPATDAPKSGGGPVGGDSGYYNKTRKAEK